MLKVLFIHREKRVSLKNIKTIYLLLTSFWGVKQQQTLTFSQSPRQLGQHGAQPLGCVLGKLRCRRPGTRVIQTLHSSSPSSVRKKSASRNSQQKRPNPAAASCGALMEDRLFRERAGAVFTPGTRPG